MNPATNPYRPTAGEAPSHLAGRADQLKDFRSLLQRLRSGQPDRTVVITGLRGVGKTVLLGAFRDMAAEEGWVAVGVVASKEAELGPQMAAVARTALLDLAPGEAWGPRTKTAAAVLKSFAQAVHADASATTGLGSERAEGRADSGKLAGDLGDVFEALGAAAVERRAGIVFLVDDIHLLSKIELEALITAAHRVREPQLPITFAGAGLPQLATLSGDPRSYAGRLLKYPSIGELRGTAARDAIVEPARALEIEIEYKAVELIVGCSDGCARFLQEHAATTWDLAKGEEQITLADAEKAQPIVEAALDEAFFRPPIQCVTPDELRYLRAMAELGPDEQRASDVAELLGKAAEHAGQHRDHLVNKGLLFTPRPDHVRFTAPQFDQFMRRHMPFEPVQERAERRWLHHFGRHRHQHAPEAGADRAQGTRGGA